MGVSLLWVTPTNWATILAATACCEIVTVPLTKSRQNQHPVYQRSSPTFGRGAYRLRSTPNCPYCFSAGYSRNDIIYVDNHHDRSNTMLNQRSAPHTHRHFTRLEPRHFMSRVNMLVPRIDSALVSQPFLKHITVRGERMNTTSSRVDWTDACSPSKWRKPQLNSNHQ